VLSISSAIDLSQSFAQEPAVSRHHIFLALAALSLVFPTSRRIVVGTVRNVVAPIIAVLFIIAMRVR
jgi:hypothetical protein